MANMRQLVLVEDTFQKYSGVRDSGGIWSHARRTVLRWILNIRQLSDLEDTGCVY